MDIVPQLPVSKRPIGIYIPKGVRLPGDPIFADYKEDALYFLHLIFRERIFKKRHWDEFVPLKQAYLKQQMHQLQVKPIIDGLTRAGLIECDGTYMTGRKSFGYRLRQDLRCAEHERYPLSDKCLLRRLKRWHDNGQDIEPTVPVHVGLKRCFGLLTIDSSAALDDIDAFYESTRKALKGDNTATRKRKKAQYKRNAERFAIDAWVNGETFFHIDDYGRIHTNLANLSSRLRKYVSLQGEPLYEIDLCNSQPLILACLMIQFFKSGKKSLSKNDDEEFDFKKDLLRFLERLERRKARKATTHPSTTTPHNDDTSASLEQLNTKTPKVVPSNPSTTTPHNDDIFGSVKLHEDSVEYIRLCQAGTLYEETLSKKEFFKSIFGRQLPEILRKRFPSLVEVIGFAKHDDYRHLAHMLQRTESRIMILGAASRLIEKGKFVATIHDSLIVRKPDIKRAIRYIEEEFEEWKVVPKYRIKRLTGSRTASAAGRRVQGGIVAQNASDAIQGRLVEV